MKKKEKKAIGGHSREGAGGEGAKAPKSQRASGESYAVKMSACFCVSLLNRLGCTLIYFRIF